ncbi:unnamed protein product [Urochloa humidicola]
MREEAQGSSGFVAGTARRLRRWRPARGHEGTAARRVRAGLQQRAREVRGPAWVAQVADSRPSRPDPAPANPWAAGRKRVQRRCYWEEVRWLQRYEAPQRRRSRESLHDCGPGLPSFERAFWNEILQAKAGRAFLLVDGDGALRVVLPVGGVILEPIHVAQGSLGENPVQFWTSDGGTTGVVTSLEASFLETHLRLWHCRIRRWSCETYAGGAARRFGAGGKFEGGC